MSWTLRNWNVKELNYDEDDNLMIDDKDREDLLRERQFVPSREIQEWYESEVHPGANIDPIFREAVEKQVSEVKSSLQWVGRAQTRVQNLLKKMPQRYYSQVHILLAEQYNAWLETTVELRKLEQQINEA